jgi:hypothetical protein
LGEGLGFTGAEAKEQENAMSWYDVLQQVQGSGDPRRMAMLIAAMWQALADGHEWVLTNALMNTYAPYNLASALDGGKSG